MNHYMENNFNLAERCYPDMSSKRVREDHFERYRFAKNFVAGKIVADIGCGEGYGSDILFAAGATRVIGIDNDVSIIAHAKTKYPNVDFRVGDATKTGLPDTSVDMVTCFEVWHHLDQHEKFIPEMKRILKPGGLFIFSVPNKRVIYLNPFHRKMLTEFYRKNFDKKILERMLENDFQIEAWYGQRFVRKILVHPAIRLGLFLLKTVFPFTSERILNAYKLGSGPAVLPLDGDHARIFVVLARTKREIEISP